MGPRYGYKKFKSNQTKPKQIPFYPDNLYISSIYSFDLNQRGIYMKMQKFDESPSLHHEAAYKRECLVITVEITNTKEVGEKLK